MHFCIDGNEANVQNRVGSNVYAFEILKQFEENNRNNQELTFTIVLREPHLPDMPSQREGWSYQILTPKPLWTQLALPIHLFLNKNKYDAFFSPGHYAPFICPIPYATTVMDTAYLEFPDHFKPSDLFQLTHWTKMAVKGAKKIFAISLSTKKSIIKNYHKNEADVVVAYPGIGKFSKLMSPAQCNSFLKKYKITKPYILYVGTIQPRKNLPILIEGFEIFRRMLAGRSLKKSYKSKNSFPDVKLVLAGKIGWLAEETLARIDNSALKKDIIQTGFINDSQKYCLYQNAMATVLLGQAEGFGLPPLESMAFGTPAVVANSASLPEVVGKIGSIVKNLNPQEVAQVLYDIHEFSAKDRAKYRKSAIEHSKNFDWKNTAEIILKTLENLPN